MNIRTNFVCLQDYDPQFMRIGMLAEKYFPDDPNTSLIKLRQLGEILAQAVAAEAGLYASSSEKQADLLGRLRYRGVLPREVGLLFDDLRQAGNAAVHGLRDDHATALRALRSAWQLAVWFHQTSKAPDYRSGAFLPPQPPVDESESLREELARVQNELAEFDAKHQTLESVYATASERLAQTFEEKAFWEAMALQVEADKTRVEKEFAAQQALNAPVAAKATQTVVERGARAAERLEMNEAQTREMIDAALRAAGWEADTQNLRHALGVRPEKGRNLAIAEWPAASGPADYVLFCGLTPVATVEAKRWNVDVADLGQAERYGRDFRDASPQGPWGEFRVPFAFATNGRPFLRQIRNKSGIWFRDLRRTQNHAGPLNGWHSPEGLLALLKQDVEAAERKLEGEGFDYGFEIRDYQRKAILAVEAAIAEGRREMLVAMATGTGKTKTCVALAYRLLKAKRFRRILFLVDRSALGEQAADAFKETRMESLQTFADVFGLKEVEDPAPDANTEVHIATVQGMVKRILYNKDGIPALPIDAYDLVIVDECHRGYLLDREMSETELEFRDFDDYVSKYRRVLDYFDAVKVGLTATPALHTTQIFGPPIFTYRYREAAVDGHLIDHEPPVTITTQLSQSGIRWRVGESIKAYDPERAQIDLFETPDEVKFEVEEFNRKVITQPFNEVVCAFLAGELDPASDEKTLVFCANDAHADLVVSLLKDAFKDRYGSADNDAVAKITGAADKPLSLIRRYKNERMPNVAVTVDLLTTGVDVRPLCNLVFLRRVNSRILYDQMLGRATRPCPEIEKETFRIFDAVGLYDALGAVTDMKPVVVDPSISFAQLAGELATNHDPQYAELVRDQFLAKLQRVKSRLGDARLQEFEALVESEIGAFARTLKTTSLDEVADWFAAHPGVGELLDRKTQGSRPRLFISDHEDALVSVERGYGVGQRPEDYLEAFAAFVRTHRNTVPALLTVLTRPRDLTRKELRELALALDEAGFTETNLTIAHRDATNEEIAARIVGFVRQAAIGDPLVPYEERVDVALRRILASRTWTGQQRRWLTSIAQQTKANVVVDRETLDDPNLLFRREGGGFARLDKLFDGGLDGILGTFKEALWSLA